MHLSQRGNSFRDDLVQDRAAVGSTRDLIAIVHERNVPIQSDAETLETGLPRCAGCRLAEQFDRCTKGRHIDIAVQWSCGASARGASAMRPTLVERTRSWTGTSRSAAPKRCSLSPLP